MLMKIKPTAVATQEKWDIGKLTDFAADMLEDANDHNVSAALRSLNCGDYDLAHAFITLEEDQEIAGELTPELLDRRNGLLDRLRKVCKGA